MRLRPDVGMGWIKRSCSESVGPLQQWALEVLADPAVLKHRADSGGITRSGAAKRTPTTANGSGPSGNPEAARP